MYEIISTSEKETRKIASNIAKYLNRGDIITLEGELGIGKTTFAKGIAEGLQVKRNVTSPTFTIVKQYEGLLPLYHMDAYRLEHSTEDIGFDEYFEGNGICIVEWATFIEEYLPQERLNIHFSNVENGRKLTFHPQGAYYEKKMSTMVESIMN